MKVKLYHKFIEAARKRAIKHKIARSWMFRPKTDGNQFICRPVKCINEEGKLVMDDSKLVVVSPANFLSFVWNDLLWKETWRKKYAKYSKKYWEPEAMLKRVIRTGKTD